MVKILFVMFQGAGTNLKSWNEYTKSKFLDRLKELGTIYTYQDKVNNIWHYDKSDSEHTDFDSDIDFDLNYVKVDKHIKMVYDDICKKYNIDNYKIILIGWSAGCLLALYFAQIYKSKCFHVILLDSAVWTPENMKLRLEEIDASGINNKPVSNIKFKKMLKNWKQNHTDRQDMYKINDVCHHIRSTFISKNLNLKLSVPTTAFVNIQSPEGKAVVGTANNSTRFAEVKILEKNNPKTFSLYHSLNKIQYILDNLI